MIYAIDYGTTNSLLAAAANGKSIDPIKLDHDHTDPTIFRSVMFFPNDGGPASFARTAIRNYDENRAQGRLFRSVKKFLPARSFRGTMIGTDFYELPEIVSRFLREMKSRADTHFQTDVPSVVMGRPARFSPDDGDDRLAEDRLRQAAHLAGFKHVDFYPEPLAAAYEFRKQMRDEKLVLVADLGGGTSDFTVLKLGLHPFKPEDVLSVGGISVAGDAVDSSVMTGKIAPLFGSEVTYRFPMSSNVLTMPRDIKHKLGSPPDIALMTRNEVMSFLKSVQKATLNEQDKLKLDRLFALIEDNLGFRIYESIEELKISVCRGVKSVFDFPYPDIEIRTEMTPGEFHRCSRETLARILEALDETVKRAGVSPKEIDLVCCTGGTAKIPEISRSLEARFGHAIIEQFKNFHSVIQGLAERAKELDQGTGKI